MCNEIDKNIDNINDELDQSTIDALFNDNFDETTNDNDTKNQTKNKKKSKTIEEIEERDDSLSDDEVMIMRDMPIEGQHLDQNATITIAPGENTKPVPSYEIKHLDELIFNREFGGQITNKENKLHYSQKSKFQIQNVDGRHRNTCRLLYIAKRQIEKRVHGTANVVLRSLNKNQNLKATNSACKRF